MYKIRHLSFYPTIVSTYGNPLLLSSNHYWVIETIPKWLLSVIVLAQPNCLQSQLHEVDSKNNGKQPVSFL